MKKFYSVGAFAIVTMALFSSCEREVINPNEGSSIATIEFTARTTETRTIFGTKEQGSYPILWTGNEGGVEVIFTYKETKDDGTTSDGYKNTTAELVVGEGGTEATFTGKFSIAENMSGNYYYYAVSPSAVYTGFSSSNGITITVPSSQTPLANSVDEGAQLLIASDGPETTIPKTVDFEFDHATAYAKITLKDLVIPNGVTMNSIAFTAGKDIAGRWRYKDGSMTVNSGVSTITIDPANVQNGVVWLALAPVDLRGSTFKITVNTSAGPIQKEIEFPSSGSAGNFQSGHVSPFTINMNGLTPGEKVQYTLVKNIADLTLESEVIIAAKNANFAISTTQNTNNRAQTAVTKNSDGTVIEDPSDDVQIFKIANGSRGGRYAFYYLDEEEVPNYICAAASGNNYLRTTTTLDGNASWNITIDSNSGVASIVADGSYTRNTLQYNGDSKIFACYSSASQSPVAIYKKAGTGSGAINPKVYYSVSVSSSVTNGTVNVNPSSAEEGDIITLQPVPNDGYAFVAWDVKGATSGNAITVGEDNKFTMPGENVTVMATFSKGQTVTPIEFTATNFKGQGTSGSGSAITSTLEPITVSSDKAYCYDEEHVRVYQNGTITIVASGQHKINKIVFTSTASGTANNGPSKLSIPQTQDGTYSYSGNKGTWTAPTTGGVASVTFNATAQFRFTSVIVTYE